MMPTNSRLDGLRQQFVALRARFEDVGARAGAASPGLVAGVAPVETLVDDLRSTSGDFDRLRHAIVDEFADFPNTPDPATLNTLKALDLVLTALERVHAEQARRPAWETARDEAVAALDRVIALVHREDRESAALDDCQAQARELREALAEAPSGDVAQLGAHMRPFVELITLVDGWNRLDDQQCVALRDAIAENFGRPLGLAALRGLVGPETEAPAAPEPAILTAASADFPLADAAETAARQDDVLAAEPEPAPAEAAAIAAEPIAVEEHVPTPEAMDSTPAGSVVTAPEPIVPVAAPPSHVAPEPTLSRTVAAPAVATAAARARPSAPSPALATVASAPAVPAQPVASPAPVAQPAEAAAPHGRRGAPPGSTLVTQIRLSGQHIEIETPEQQREREELFQRLAEDTAQWWLSARAGWESIVQRGLRPADAVRDTLKRFPHLLAVPLSRADEYDGGRIAEGYGILLQRLEKEEPGFVREALTRLNPQLTGRAPDDNFPLGQELYQYVVAEGRLYKTFPAFLSEVLGHVLPEPGLWLSGTISETEAATTVVTRPEQPGSHDANTRTLTSPAERYMKHTFEVATGPLTARVFTVETSELPVPIDLEIRLAEEGTPRDHAWIVVAPLGGKPEKPRKHRAGGTKIEHFGRDHGAVWVAVFNSDANADKRYELTIALTRRGPKIQPIQPAFANKASPFGKKR
jgi:hypothetical protein